MQSRVLRSVVLIPLLVAMSACSSLKSAGHEYVMRGQVVAIDGKEAVVCLGTRDGAQVGQQLSVYRSVEKGVGGPGKNPPRWERINVGAVRLVEVVDEHFAKAQVTSGEVSRHDIVELKP